MRLQRFMKNAVIAGIIIAVIYVAAPGLFEAYIKPAFAFLVLALTGAEL